MQSYVILHFTSFAVSKVIPISAFANPCPNGEPLMSPGPTPFNRPQTCNALSTTSSCPSGYWCHVGAVLDTTVCCSGAGDPCIQPVATGVGNASLPRFYYDQSSRQCIPFTYSGTKGNQNNFPSMEACRMACRGTVPIIISSLMPWLISMFLQNLGIHALVIQLALLQDKWYFVVQQTRIVAQSITGVILVLQLKPLFVVPEVRNCLHKALTSLPTLNFYN